MEMWIVLASFAFSLLRYSALQQQDAELRFVQMSGLLSK